MEIAKYLHHLRLLQWLIIYTIAQTKRDHLWVCARMREFVSEWVCACPHMREQCSLSTSSLSKSQQTDVTILCRKGSTGRMNFCLCSVSTNIQVYRQQGRNKGDDGLEFWANQPIYIPLGEKNLVWLFYMIRKPSAEKALLYCHWSYLDLTWFPSDFMIMCLILWNIIWFSE